MELHFNSTKMLCLTTQAPTIESHYPFEITSFYLLIFTPHMRSIHDPVHLLQRMNLKKKMNVTRVHPSSPILTSSSSLFNYVSSIVVTLIHFGCQISSPQEQRKISMYILYQYKAHIEFDYILFRYFWLVASVQAQAGKLSVENLTTRIKVFLNFLLEQKVYISFMCQLGKFCTLQGPRNSFKNHGIASKTHRCQSGNKNVHHGS